MCSSGSVVLSYRLTFNSFQLGGSCASIISCEGISIQIIFYDVSALGVQSGRLISLSLGCNCSLLVLCVLAYQRRRLPLLSTPDSYVGPTTCRFISLYCSLRTCISFSFFWLRVTSSLFFWHISSIFFCRVWNLAI